MTTNIPELILSKGYTISEFKQVQGNTYFSIVPSGFDYKAYDRIEDLGIERKGMGKWSRGVKLLNPTDDELAILAMYP